MAIASVTLTTICRACVAVVAILCAAVAIGWIFEIPSLTSFVSGWARMSLPSSLCFLLAGASIVLLTTPVGGTWQGRVFRQVALAFVAAIGFCALADFFARGGTAAAAASSGAVFGAANGRIAPAAAFDFLVLAGSLLLPLNRLGGLYGRLIAVGLVVCGLAITGYAYGVEALYRVHPFSAMALPTSICFVFLFVAALLARPADGWIAPLLANDSGGAAARRILPAILLLPFALAGAMVAATQMDFIDAPFGFAVVAVTAMLGLLISIIAMAAWLSGRDAEQRRGQRLIEALVENTPAVIYVKDLAGRYLMVNQRFADIFHVDRAATAGKSDHDLFSKDAADAFRAMDARVAEADHALIEEETAPLDDGVHTYVSVKAPLRDDSGRAYAVYGISTDITEQRRIENALLASEQRNRLIVDSALDAIVTIDSAGNITGWSPQAEKTFGWTYAEALGRPVDETIMPERFRKAHRDGLARYLATREARVLNRRIELAALHRNGQEFPVELSITPIRLDGDLGFSAFVRDITERRQAEEKLQIQHDRLHLLEQITRAIGQRQDVRSIFQVAVRTLEDRLPADFVCICDYDPVSQLLTVAHVGLASENLGRELGIIVRAEIPIDRNGLSHCVGGELVYEPDIARVDFPFPRRLAAQGLRALVVAPLGVEGEVFGVLVVARLQPGSFQSADCEFLRQLGEHVALAAHQAQLRDRLQKAYEDLRQTQQAVLEQERLRAIGQMASGIAHDINNAISPVAVYTQSMLEREPNLPPAVRDYLELVGRVVKDVAATVGRMRDFYRARGEEAELAPLDLNELVPQVIELTRARWSDMPQRGGVVIKVSTELETDLPQVMGNASEIREALTNLIFNAVDAMPQGGVLTVKTVTLPPAASGTSRVRLEVGDTGPGMNEETRRRCPEPFFTTKGERGTGLGLTMVQGAARRHGAELDIDSAPGEGTRVRLDFDATADAQRKRMEARAAAEVAPLRLLLVDDDPAVLSSTEFVLQLSNHDVTTADGGQAAIKALRAAHKAGLPFDLVITDLGMPYVDGNQVASAVKELFPSTPVVLLTGWGRRMARTDATPAHIDYVLPKPLELDQLREIFVEISRGAR